MDEYLKGIMGKLDDDNVIGDFMGGLTQFIEEAHQKTKELAEKDQPGSRYTLEEITELYKHLPDGLESLTSEQRITRAEETRDMFANGIELGFSDGTTETVYPTDPTTGKRIK